MWEHMSVMPAAGTARLHPVRLLERQAERLLAEDVLAGLGRGDDRVRMEVVGQADVDRVDEGRREHLAVVEEDLGAAGAIGVVSGVLRIDVGDGA